ncbi:hypothetical protein GCM10007304_14770 [Rhodococcoides trifolii]|uniref:Uncharacterized protein n=1 Tax=Rhodococcoides trifolii TaxID=908250 RepID=A0A917FSL0_9NOCA|nr:hypothetical protein [Rhodococcus trifolii]GGG01816.1 hypothetical protein GCM10007304_14770 [Rhodococcus trifolii]
MFGINGLGKLLGGGNWLDAEVARRQAQLAEMSSGRGTREGIPVSTWRALPDSPTADPSKLVQKLPD